MTDLTNSASCYHWRIPELPEENQSCENRWWLHTDGFSCQCSDVSPCQCNHCMLTCTQTSIKIPLYCTVCDMKCQKSFCHVKQSGCVKLKSSNTSASPGRSLEPWPLNAVSSMQGRKKDGMMLWFCCCCLNTHISASSSKCFSRISPKWGEQQHHSLSNWQERHMSCVYRLRNQ